MRPPAPPISLSTAPLLLKLYRPPLRSFVCNSCLSKASDSSSKPFTFPTAYHNDLFQHKSFTTAPIRQKRTGGKQFSKQNISRAEQFVVHSASDDPGDFSTLEEEITSIKDGLREELKKIKAGGIDIEAVENVRVRLKGEGASVKGGKGSKSKSAGNEVRIKDIAQVVPRGRVVVIMVGEKEHHKAALSALSSLPVGGANNSSGNAFPIPLSSNIDHPLEIHLPVPPTTTDSRRHASASAHEKGEAALHNLREARGAQKKRLRALELSRKSGPDSLRRAERDLEKVNLKAKEELENLVADRKKALERV